MDHYSRRSASISSNNNHPGSSRYTSASHSRATSSVLEEGTQQQQSLRQHPSLASISAPSFAAFRNQTSSIPVASGSPVQRKQFALQSHTPRAASLAEIPSPRIAPPTARPLSLASPRTRNHPGQEELSPSSGSSPTREQYNAPYTYRSHHRGDSIDSRILDSDHSSSLYGADSRRSSIPIHARYAQEHTIAHAPQQSVSSVEFAALNVAHLNRDSTRDSTLSMNGHKEPPEMRLDGVRRTLTDESMSSAGDSTSSRPRSTGSGKLRLFGWKSNGQKSNGESPTTTFSDRSVSALPSPHLQTPVSQEPNGQYAPGLTPPRLDIRKANMGSPLGDYFEAQGTPILIGTPETNAHVRELERELAHVSTELASSVKREMELEDELDRMKVEGPNLQLSDGGRRTSDYFSDSGASSTRYPVTDVDSKLEQMEKTLRKAEQEKAQVKIEMASRLQTELSRRRDLEQMVQKLEEQLQKKFDEDEEQKDAEERIDELESSLEDTRRLLRQERQAKGSFEDLYSATREEMERHRNERDNLRDEIVPGLRARLEGLEAEASDTQALVYENTRMQQELVVLKSKMHGRFDSIAEEYGVSPPLGSSRVGLSRSGSLARSQSKRGGSLTRSGSVKDREGGRHRSGSLNGDAVKEIEDQRDALHKALQLLMLRYERQQKEHQRAIKKLTSAKTRAEQYSPNRTAYHREVSFLKHEVAALRKRTEDALEQKWQYEKGLSGIKMDLDRAELETRGLRIILQEHDILAPSTRTQLDGQEGDQNPDDKLKLSISTAEAERDQARRIAEQYRDRAAHVDDSSAIELMNSANRMDQLAEELDKQVRSNVQLRARLADAVAKGEHEQKESNGRITEMQKRLTIMEDSIIAAQQHSENTLATNEAEVRRLEEASSPALQRLTITIPEPNKLAPTSPMFQKSPKLNGKRMTETSLLEMSKTQMLERKVKEMEGLLREAEEDMHEVVQRVTQSQIEVNELQTERDAALTQMRKLQGLIVEEREKAEVLMR